MKKILHIGYSHRYDDIRIFQKECISLAKAGYDVTFVTSNKNSGEETPDTSIVKRIVIPLSGPRGIRGIRYWSNLKKFIQSEEYDIYHIHEFDLWPIAKFLIKRDRRVIYDMHEDAPKQKIPFLKNKFGKFYKPVLKKIIKTDDYIIKNADYNIIVVPSQEKHVVALSKKYEMICNFPIVSDRKVKKSDRENYICYAGSITEERGITRVIEALDRIDAHMLLAGKISNEYLGKLKQLKNWDKVDYLGYMDADGVAEMYAKSKIGVFLADPSPNNLISYPNKLFEYMEASLPVICSDFKVWKELIEGNECGTCIPYNDIDKFIYEANRILRDEPMGRSMGRNGHNVIMNKYNWESQIPKLLKLYKDVG